MKISRTGKSSTPIKRGFKTWAEATQFRQDNGLIGPTDQAWESDNTVSVVAYKMTPQLEALGFKIETDRGEGVNFQIITEGK